MIHNLTENSAFEIKALSLLALVLVLLDQLGKLSLKALRARLRIKIALDMDLELRPSAFSYLVT